MLNYPKIPLRDVTDDFERCKTPMVNLSNYDIQNSNTENINPEESFMDAYSE